MSSNSKSIDNDVQFLQLAEGAWIAIEQSNAYPQILGNIATAMIAVNNLSAYLKKHPPTINDINAKAILTALMTPLKLVPSIYEMTGNTVLELSKNIESTNTKAVLQLLQWFAKQGVGLDLTPTDPTPPAQNLTNALYGIASAYTSMCDQKMQDYLGFKYTTYYPTIFPNSTMLSCVHAPDTNPTANLFCTLQAFNKNPGAAGVLLPLSKAISQFNSHMTIIEQTAKKSRKSVDGYLYALWTYLNTPVTYANGNDSLIHGAKEVSMGNGNPESLKSLTATLTALGENKAAGGAFMAMLDNCIWWEFQKANKCIYPSCWYETGSTDAWQCPS